MSSSVKKWVYPFFRAVQLIYDYLLYLFIRKSGKGAALDTIRKRILILRQDSVGDLVMFSASLPLYRQLFKEDYLVLLVKDSGYEIAKKCPYVDEVWSLPERKFRRSFLERWQWCRKLSQAGFDIAIRSAYSSSFTELDCLIGWTHAPRRVAHQCLDSIRRRDRAGPYFTELVPSDREWKFEIDRNYDMLRYLGYTGDVSYQTEVWITEADRGRAFAFKGSLKGRPYAVLVPRSRDEKKNWDVENFIVVVKEVQKRFPFDWIIDGSKHEKEICSYIVDRLSASSIPAYNTAGDTTLRELSVIIEGSTFLLANDTGPIHIAAAVGTPTVCVLGGGFYGRFYPYPDNPLTVAVTNKLPCYNCHWRCILNEEECITKIKVEDVVKAVTVVLLKPVKGSFKPSRIK
jgi:ADP-heptose:LPS heptosyltransferase